MKMSKKNLKLSTTNYLNMNEELCQVGKKSEGNETESNISGIE